METARNYKKAINDISDIPRTETGDLLLMAIAHITGHSCKDKTPDEVIANLQQKRFDVMYINGGGA